MKLKFRAYNNKTHMFVNPSNFAIDGNGKLISHVHGWAIDLSNLEVTQSIGINDRDGKEIFIGDILLMKIERLSSSYSTWYKETNKHHGWFDLKIIIKSTRCGFRIDYDEIDVKDLEKPMGKEVNEQIVATCRIEEYNLNEAIIIGNIFERPELAKTVKPEDKDE